MTDYNPPTDAELGPEKPGKASVFIRIRDMTKAMFEKAAGAPVLADGYVSTAMIGDFTPDQENLLKYVLAESSNSVGVPVKKYERAIGRSGTLSISFKIRSTINAYPAYCRIYVNGSAVGTTRTNVTDAVVEYIEDITVTKDDLIQLYIWTNNAAVYCELSEVGYGFNLFF